MRAPEARDAGAYADFYASARSEIIGGPLDLKRAWKVLTNDAGHWMLRGFGWWVLDVTGGARAVGSVGFHLPEGERDVELGWSLFSGEGHGYATEAARAALDWAATAHPDWTRLVSHIDRTNVASQRVAARLGATDTGEATPHNPDCNVWLHGAAA
nr:GNAT family N-acetyltransferase [Jannaschia sp. Os4]